MISYYFSLKSKSYDSLITRRSECCVLEIPRFNDSEIFAYTPLLNKDIIFRIMGSTTMLPAIIFYRREVYALVI